MDCPICKGSSEVYDTRRLQATVRRRRKCTKCFHRFTTYEVPADALELIDTTLYTILDDTIVRIEQMRNQIVGSAMPAVSMRKREAVT